MPQRDQPRCDATLDPMRQERRLTLFLWALGGLVALPLLVRGPGIVLDDWFTLWWGWRDGVWRAAGSTQARARPVGALVYDLQYGVIGPHPGIWIALQALATAATAVTLSLLLRRWLQPLPAAAVAAVWLLSANHATLDSWGAGSLAALSLLLLLSGGLVLLRGSEGASAVLVWCGVGLLTASPLVYEATLPAAFAAAVLLPRLAGRVDRWAHAACRAVPVVAAAAVLVTGSVHLRSDQGWFDLRSTVSALAGEGIARWSAPSIVLTTIVLAVSALVLVRPFSSLSRRLLPAGPAMLIVGGFCVAILGYLPFVRYPITALGIGDRANVVAAVGGSMVWVGIGSAAIRHRRWAWPAVAVFLTLLASARLGRALDWAAAGRDAEAVLAVMLPRVAAAPPDVLLVAGPPPEGHHGIVGLTGTIKPAVQYRLRDRQRRATVAVTEREWEATPASNRVDIAVLQT